MSREKTGYFILLGITLFIRVFLVFRIPFGQTVSMRLEGLNDEPSHYHYVQFLAEQKQLPVQTHSARDPGAYERNDFEYHQPPLYYLISALVYSLAGEAHALICVRFLSCFFGIVSLFMIYKIFRLIGLSLHVSMVAVVFSAFLPTHAYFSALVSNDSLCWFISLLILYECVLIFNNAIGNRPAPFQKSIRIAIYLAFGMLTKSSIIIFYPFIVIVYGYGYIVSKNKKWIVHGFLLLLMATALASPWYVRNWVVYQSIFAMDVANGPFQRSLFGFTPFISFLKQLVIHFWFPMQHVKTGAASRILNVAGFGILFVHGVLALSSVLRNKIIPRFDLMFLVLLAVNFSAVIQYNWIWTNAEGRFLFPSLAGIVYLIIVPLGDLFNKRQMERYLLWTVMAYSLYPWLYLLCV